jgi:hypothetical protein
MQIGSFALLVFVGVWTFSAFRRKEVRMSGMLFSRVDQPIAYWIWTLWLALMTLACAMVALDLILHIDMRFWL